MRQDEIAEFATKLHELEQQYGVVVHSDNYHTRAIINDVKSEMAYHYKDGKIELDHNTFM